ncbi:MAG: Uma2 family endonuclease [Xenococcaceae cyanobacterium]
MTNVPILPMDSGSMPEGRSKTTDQTPPLQLQDLEPEVDLDSKPFNHLPVADSAELAECGWRIEILKYPDGTEAFIKIPLTEEDFLHPKEDYHLPNSIFHSSISRQVADMLTQRYLTQPDVGVFDELIVEWDDANLKDNCPDVMVVFGMKETPNPEKTRLVVAKEGVRPAFILEVVSPRYRKADRETKVKQYASAKVQEYVIVDRRQYRGKIFEEVLGYRLKSGQYQGIPPDEQGRICCKTIGVLISLRDGQIVLEDAVTGQPLKTAQEWKEEAEQEHQRAEQEHQRVEELQARLAQYQKQFGDLE